MKDSIFVSRTQTKTTEIDMPLFEQHIRQEKILDEVNTFLSKLKLLLFILSFCGLPLDNILVRT